MVLTIQCALIEHSECTEMHTVFIRIKAALKYTQGLNYTPGSAAE